MIIKQVSKVNCKNIEELIENSSVGIFYNYINMKMFKLLYLIVY